VFVTGKEVLLGVAVGRIEVGGRVAVTMSGGVEVAAS
jgi:hypothetical protein